jgi:cell division protein FtsL
MLKTKRGNEITLTYQESAEILELRSKLQELEAAIAKKTAELAKLEKAILRARHNLQLKVYYDPGSAESKAAKAEVTSTTESRNLLSQEVAKLNREHRIAKERLRKATHEDARQARAQAEPGAKKLLVDLVEAMDQAGKAAAAYNEYKRSIPGGAPGAWPSTPEWLVSTNLKRLITKIQKFCKE